MFSRKKSNGNGGRNGLTQTSAYDSLSAGPPPEIGGLPYKPSAQNRLANGMKQHKGTPDKAKSSQSSVINGNIDSSSATHVDGFARELSRGRSEISKPVNGSLTPLQPAKRFAKSTDSLSSVSPVRSERYFNILNSALTPEMSKDGKLSMYSEEVADRNFFYSDGPNRRSLMEEVSSLDFTDKNLSEASSSGTSKQRKSSGSKRIHSFAQVYGVRWESPKSIDRIVSQKPPPYNVAESR